MVRHLLIGTIIAALVGASCSSGTPTPAVRASATPQSSAGGEPTNPAGALVDTEGPLIGLTLGATIDEKGNSVDPNLVYEPSAPQVTAVAFAGATEGEILFEWFVVLSGAVPGEEPERTKLFEHRVATAPLERAFSVGTSPGTLASGIYAVIGSIGTASTIAEFEVTAQPGAIARAVAAVGTEGPPQSGQSGTRSVLDDLAYRGPFSNLAIGSTQSYRPEGIPVFLTTVWLELETPAERSFTAEGGIASGGASVTERLVHPAGTTGPIDLAKRLNPCHLPGGSDRPDTVLTLTNQIVSGGPGAAETFPAGTVTLGPDTRRPVFTTFDFEKPDRAEVEEGEEIGFDIIARDQNRAGGGWQTGVQRLRVVANGEPVEGAVVMGPDGGTTCNDAARILNLQGRYRVPPNPPAVIELCAQARDYYVLLAFAERCNTYYTKEVWTGTMKGTGTGNCADSVGNPYDVQTYDGTVTLVVDDDGTVNGTWTMSIHQSACIDETPAEGTTTSSGEQRVNGTRSQPAFALSGFVIDQLVITGATAKGTWSWENFPSSGSVAVELSCRSCNP